MTRCWLKTPASILIYFGGVPCSKSSFCRGMGCSTIPGQPLGPSLVRRPLGPSSLRICAARSTKGPQFTIRIPLSSLFTRFNLLKQIARTGNAWTWKKSSRDGHKHFILIQDPCELSPRNRCPMQLMLSQQVTRLFCFQYMMSCNIFPWWIVMF